MLLIVLQEHLHSQDKLFDLLEDIKLSLFLLVQGLVHVLLTIVLHLQEDQQLMNMLDIDMDITYFEVP